MINKKVQLKTVILSLTFMISIFMGILAYYYYIEKTIIINEDSIVLWKPTYFRKTPNSGVITLSNDTTYPITVSVVAGQQVTWINEDAIPRRFGPDPHPAHDSVPGFGVVTLNEGESFSYTFKERGTYYFHDEEDPFEIKGIILVR